MSRRASFLRLEWGPVVLVPLAALAALALSGPAAAERGAPLPVPDDPHPGIRVKSQAAPKKSTSPVVAPKVVAVDQPEAALTPQPDAPPAAAETPEPEPTASRASSSRGTSPTLARQTTPTTPTLDPTRDDGSDRPRPAPKPKPKPVSKAKRTVPDTKRRDVRTTRTAPSTVGTSGTVRQAAPAAPLAAGGESPWGSGGALVAAALLLGAAAGGSLVFGTVATRLLRREGW